MSESTGADPAIPEKTDEADPKTSPGADRESNSGKDEGKRSAVGTAGWAGVHRPLAVFSLAMGVVSLATLVGLAVDERMLAGAPIWLKPLHFAFSLAVYGATLAWLIPRIRRFPRTAWWAGTLIALSSLAEMVIIGVQAWRGTYSHFNMTTDVNTAFMNSMTVAVIVLWTSNLVAAILVLRDRAHSLPLRYGIRLGLVLAVIGMALGMLMNNPTPEQSRAVEEGLPTLVGAHNVGVADGGPGMPLTNWSTEGGDLRIPHFVGIHALQVVPLAALAVAHLGRRRPDSRLADEHTAARLVLVVGAVWAGLLAIVTWQALRGQSLIHPDALTLTVTGALLASGALAATLALRVRR
ncbi:hypothetical protein ACF090_14600 [Streptomyces sp. NPDC014892]|uniref:hypothetical protein n=1 Tax=Streptomyces sp. NPDC014892 TaxID=3364930 RepID=UPI0036FAE3FA